MFWRLSFCRLSFWRLSRVRGRQRSIPERSAKHRKRRDKTNDGGQNQHATLSTSAINSVFQKPHIWVKIPTRTNVRGVEPQQRPDRLRKYCLNGQDSILNEHWNNPAIKSQGSLDFEPDDITRVVKPWLISRVGAHPVATDDDQHDVGDSDFLLDFA